MGRLVLAGMAALACVLRCVDDALNYPTGFRVNVVLRTGADLRGSVCVRPSIRLPFEFYGPGLGARPALPLRTSAISASALPRRL